MKNWFSRYSITARIMLVALSCLFAALLAAGLLAAALIYPFEAPLPYVLGLLAGTVVSQLRVLLMDRSIGRSLDMEEKHAKNYAGLQTTLRYLLMIAGAACAILFPRVIGVFGFVLGILSLQLSAYIANGVLKRHPDWLD